MKNGLIWKDTGFIFTKDDGTVMHPDSITDWLNKFSKEEELPHIHPHLFPHTAASTLIANGIDQVTTAAEMGHTDATTTAKIYMPTRLQRLVHQLLASGQACLQH